MCIYIYTYIYIYVHTLHYITVHYITLPYTTLHSMTLHYITFHSITYYTCICCWLNQLNSYFPRCLLFKSLHFFCRMPVSARRRHLWPVSDAPILHGSGAGAAQGLVSKLRVVNIVFKSGDYWEYIGTIMGNIYQWIGLREHL